MGQWAVGRTLITARTSRWTAEQIRANDAHEACCIFARFSAEDAGRSRIFIAKCDTPEQAAFLVGAHNTLLSKIK